jgi:3-deoxy-D-manno-octulosonic-acid transferase
VSCFTPTGSERVRSLLGDTVYHCYAPLDLPGATRRFLQTLQPHLLLIIETELWPNLYAGAKTQGIPLMIANARLTERSARSWARFPGLAGQTLQCATLIAAQSEADANRFITLGSNPGATRNVGNLKFDLEGPGERGPEGDDLGAWWDEDKTVLVAGSTHQRDETALLIALGRLLAHHPEARLVLVPRHPERFDRAAQGAADMGLRVCRFSEGAEKSGDWQCLLVDRMGALLQFYAAADLAFVGGTLAPVGGHNPLEPAALGKPLLLGPHTGHIEVQARDLVDGGAAIRVQDSDTLYEAWISLHRDPALRERMGRAGRALVEKKQGALERTLHMIETLLE